MTTIFFDMDGTLADLYGVDNWLEHIRAKSAFPYENANALLNLSVLARKLNELHHNGFRIEIISWLAKFSDEDYDRAVAEAKRKWLSTHLRSVSFDAINIVSYGICKDTFRHSNNDILFDDEQPNREAWGGQAFDVNNIIEVLKGLS